MRILHSIIILIVLSTITAFAAIPPMVNYQGKLTKADGTLLADGTYSMTFAIYNVPTAGLPLWWETNTSVQVKKGLFSVLLGSVIHLPDNIFDSTDRYFGVKVGEDAEMTPRQQIASVPFAFRAGSAANADSATTATTAAIADTVKDGAITSAKIADGAVTNNKIAANAEITANKIDFSSVINGNKQPKIFSGMFWCGTKNNGVSVQYILNYNGNKFSDGCDPTVIVTSGPGWGCTSKCDVSVQQTTSSSAEIIIYDEFTNTTRGFQWVAIGY